MKRTEITSPLEWDTLITRLPTPHVLQSWLWGEVKSRWAWQPTRLVWHRAGEPIAAAQLLTRPIPYTPWRFIYVSKGPLFDYRDPVLASEILADLEQYAHQQNALFLKIDPDVPLGYGEIATPDMHGHIFRDLLIKHGWCFSTEQIQFRNTVIINIADDETDILSHMKSKWRYNIRLATRKGVTIRLGSVDDLPMFYQMYAETAQRDKFLIRPEAYYHDVWGRFIQPSADPAVEWHEQQPQAKLLLAEVDGIPIAGLMLFICGTTAWYLYGASTRQHRNRMPNHLLQWRAMQQAKAEGCTRYDMWGAPNIFNETDSMWGVYRFKRGFNGMVWHGLGAWDYPVKPWAYRAFTEALPKGRHLLRRIQKISHYFSK